MAMSSNAAHKWDVSFLSQEIQATITSYAIGTQCDLVTFINSSCQTEKETSVLEVNNAQPCASKKFPHSPDCGDVEKADPNAWSHHPHLDYAGFREIFLPPFPVSNATARLLI